MLSHSQPSLLPFLCTPGAVPASILNKEADASFQALSTNDLPGFLESSAFQELLSSLGSYSAELVATNAQCTQFDLEVFEKFAQAARDGNVEELKLLPPPHTPPPPPPPMLASAPAPGSSVPSSKRNPIGGFLENAAPLLSQRLFGGFTDRFAAKQAIIVEETIEAPAPAPAPAPAEEGETLNA